jgi:hypothetical protein
VQKAVAGTAAGAAIGWMSRQCLGWIAAVSTCPARRARAYTSHANICLVFIGSPQYRGDLNHKDKTVAAAKMDIDQSTIVDNAEERLVEFSAEVDGEDYDFGVQYSVLKALSGDDPEDEAVQMFNMFSDEIADAGLVALARDSDPSLIVISENDLE